MFDLGYFLNYNKNFKDLSLKHDWQAVTQEQANAIATALRGANLRSLNISAGDAFEHEGSIEIEQILSSCLGVKKLTYSNLEETELLELLPLLRDPRAIVQHVELDWCITYFGNPDEIPANSDALRAIAASLAQNTKLKKLEFLLTGSRVRFRNPVDEFDNLLCNTTSIETIFNSNHTLQEIVLPHWYKLSSRTKECLELNRNENKTKVAQNKVIQYCFIGDFDLSRFASMPLSVVTEVMGLGEGMGNKQSVIFELLRTNPGLCNVSGRSVPS
jgi:hypothetical protein